MNSEVMKEFCTHKQCTLHVPLNHSGCHEPTIVVYGRQVQRALTQNDEQSLSLCLHAL